MGDLDYLTMYFHIPYCSSLCRYCMYYSEVLRSREQLDEYIEGLKGEMEALSSVFRGKRISSLYIGGGSPSIMSVDQIKYLFEIMRNNYDFDVNDDNMYSFECNPAQLDKDKIEFLAHSFINRLNVGIQTFNRKVLKAENRERPPNKDLIAVLKGLAAYAERGDLRINVDLMIGLRSQTVKMIEKDLKTLSDLNVPRITLYANRQERSAEEQKKFEAYVVESVAHLASLLDEYDLYPNENVFSEPNFFIRKTHKHSYKKVYNTQPHYNNNLGFGQASYSWITPYELYYTRWDGKYVILHDPERNVMHPKIAPKFVEAKKLRAAGDEVDRYKF